MTRSDGSSSSALVSAAESLTSSFRSAEATAMPSTGSAAPSVDELRAAPSCRSPSVMPVLRAVELAEPDRLARLRRVALRGLLAHEPEDAGDAADVGRPARSARRRRRPMPASTRAIDILPPWVVWSVFSTWTTASSPSASPRRGRVSAMSGRLVADRLEQPADAVAVLGRADQHRADRAGAHLLDEVA